MGKQKTVLISLLLVVTLASYADSQFSKLVDLFRGGSSVEPQEETENDIDAPEVNKSLSLSLSKEFDLGFAKGAANDTNSSTGGNEILFDAPPQTTPRPLTYYTPSPRFQSAPVEMHQLPLSHSRPHGPPVYPPPERVKRPTARPYFPNVQDRHETHQNDC